MVFGKTALAASVDLRTSLSISPSQSDKVHNVQKSMFYSQFPFPSISHNDNDMTNSFQVELKLPDLDCAYSWSPADLLSLTEKLGRKEKREETGVTEPKSSSPEDLAILRDFLASSSPDPVKAPDQGVVAFLHLLTSLQPASHPPLEFTVTSAIPLGAGQWKMIDGFSASHPMQKFRNAVSPDL